jgi:hypothetical protein
LDISDELDQIDNSDPLGGSMDGMDDMNAPMPPMDAEMPPMDDPTAPPDNQDGGGDMGQGEDPMGGGDEPDPMPGDPNALSAGGGQDPNAGGDGDIASKYQQLSPDQQKAADKYIDSMMNNESRFNFKTIIDEVFSDLGVTNGNFDGQTRPETRAANEALKDANPYSPDNF